MLHGHSHRDISRPGLLNDEPERDLNIHKLVMGLGDEDNYIAEGLRNESVFCTNCNSELVFFGQIYSYLFRKKH